LVVSFMSTPSRYDRVCEPYRFARSPSTRMLVA
jgi:hypothetical protein